MGVSDCEIVGRTNWVVKLGLEMQKDLLKWLGQNGQNRVYLTIEQKWREFGKKEATQMEPLLKVEGKGTGCKRVGMFDAELLACLLWIRVKSSIKFRVNNSAQQTKAEQIRHRKLHDIPPVAQSVLQSDRSASRVRWSVRGSATTQRPTSRLIVSGLKLEVS